MVPAHRAGGGGGKQTGNAHLVIRDEVEEAQQLRGCEFALGGFLWQQMGREGLEAFQ